MCIDLFRSSDILRCSHRRQEVHIMSLHKTLKYVETRGLTIVWHTLLSEPVVLWQMCWRRGLVVQLCACVTGCCESTISQWQHINLWEHRAAIIVRLVGFNCRTIVSQCSTLHIRTHNCRVLRSTNMATACIFVITFSKWSVRITPVRAGSLLDCSLAVEVPSSGPDSYIGYPDWGLVSCSSLCAHDFLHVAISCVTVQLLTVEIGVF